MSCIRVICRLRPENKIERESGGDCCISYTPTSIKIRVQERGEEYHEFSFDRVCGIEVPQQEVFETAAKPVVEGVLDGYNGTIFAYGQTGSGKTYTMEGPDLSSSDYKGIIPRMMDALFQGLVDASESTEFTLRVSFLEIYLERIHDLLDCSKTNLQVKEDKQRGIYVQNATEIYVSSPSEMMKVMSAGSSNRSIAATRMNERSSRSHSIFCVTVDQRDLQGNRKSGRLYFVDLAGSESVGKTQASGQQLKEAMMINKSLSALGNVINALTDKANSYIPYRDSKLTRILQESIGGNSQTSLIIACSMSSYNDKETLSTLRFGQRAKKIQNKPIVNQERSAKELLKQIEHMQNEINKQAEIINKINKHIQINYANQHALSNEIGDIINGSFVVENNSNKTHAEKKDSEYALTLLKQHIEIVKLNEELQTIKLEKKELEDEISYRNKELSEAEFQLSEIQTSLLQERKLNSHFSEELQMQCDKLSTEAQNANLKVSKVLKVCDRLKADLSIISREIPKSEQWSEILMKSINEAMALLVNISNLPASELDFIDAKLKNCEDFSASVREQELQSQLEAISAQFDTKCNEIEQFKIEITEKNSEINKLKNDCEMLYRQLDTKVKNIEEERASIATEMKFKDIEIQDLRESIKREKEKVENLKLNAKKLEISDTQDRLEELCNERQKLFEEIVNLRRELDLREEQLHNSLQKNKRLERQISIQSNKQIGNFSRALSPNSQSFGEFNQNFTKKISKPLRGGGGNISNFQKNNQIISTDSLIKNRKDIEKISNQGSGLQSMIKDLFGGLLG